MTPIWSEPTALGFSVFPCQYLTKRPALKWEPYQASPATPEQLAMWASSQSNVATATGPVSGAWVLDTDSPEAEAALLALGALPATLSVKTPRGRHRYFRYPSGGRVGNRARLGGVLGIDARGDGGYVMSPGSFFWPDEKEIAEGKLPGRYEWEQAPTRDAIVDAPEWLIALVTRSNEPAASYGELAAPAVATETSDYGRRALTAECNSLRAAQPGERNDQLNRSAFAVAQLVAGGDITAEDAAGALRVAAAEIGLEADETEQTLASGWKSGVKQPRKGVSVDAAAAFAVAPVLPAAASAEPVPRDPKMRDRDQAYMTAAQQPQFFRGCVYVSDENRVWTGRKMLDKARFDTELGGHVFYLDAESSKKTDSAWDAFTKSLVNIPDRVDTICFRPHHPSSDIIEEEGLRILNIFSPIETRRLPGDPSRFLNLLGRILPVKGDRDIILAYMASLVQNPGRKFQWWPVIQGTEGNGKTFLLSCLEHVVGRRYTHMPNAPELARNGLKFNGWVMGNLLCGVEEISLGHKRDFLEEFKPIVTNRRVPIERKGVDQITGDNFLNGILMTNHQDGVPITVDTRRYAVFFTAQQSKGDKLRDGMNGRYFTDLYTWAEGTGPHAALGRNGGYAIVADYLANYAIPKELDPAGDCTEAPPTSSFGAALRASLGKVEQEILEAVEQGLVGFMGGWISSLYVDALIERLRASVPRTKRRDMMRVIGYVPHPGLPEGRVNNAVRPDNARPRLYLKMGHPALGVTEPADIAKLYSDAQEGRPTLALVS